ncbi:MAG: type II toxin-antitoxin system HicA family toxin [Pirellulales bacterium]
MSKKHDRTLAAIFENPVPAGIRWRDIESLFVHLGAEITAGRGSRVRVFLNGVRAVFHRPHPQPDTDKGAVMSVRAFLTAAGVAPCRT